MASRDRSWMSLAESSGACSFSIESKTRAAPARSPFLTFTVARKYRDWK